MIPSLTPALVKGLATRIKSLYDAAPGRVKHGQLLETIAQAAGFASHGAFMKALEAGTALNPVVAPASEEAWARVAQNNPLHLVVYPSGEYAPLMFERLGETNEAGMRAAAFSHGFELRFDLISFDLLPLPYDAPIAVQVAAVKQVLPQHDGWLHVGLWGTPDGDMLAAYVRSHEGRKAEAGVWEHGYKFNPEALKTPADSRLPFARPARPFVASAPANGMHQVWPAEKILELHTAIDKAFAPKAPDDLFAKISFEELKRDVPFKTLVDAVVLPDPDAHPDHWRGARALLRLLLTLKVLPKIHEACRHMDLPTPDEPHNLDNFAAWWLRLQLASGVDLFGAQMNRDLLNNVVTLTKQTFTSTSIPGLQSTINGVYELALDKTVVQMATLGLLERALHAYAGRTFPELRDAPQPLNARLTVALPQIADTPLAYLAQRGVGFLDLARLEVALRNGASVLLAGPVASGRSMVLRALTNWVDADTKGKKIHNQWARQPVPLNSHALVGDVRDHEGATICLGLCTDGSSVFTAIHADGKDGAEALNRFAQLAGADQSVVKAHFQVVINLAPLTTKDADNAHSASVFFAPRTSHVLAESKRMVVDKIALAFRERAQAEEHYTYHEQAEFGGLTFEDMVKKGRLAMVLSRSSKTSHIEDLVGQIPKVDIA